METHTVVSLDDAAGIPIEQAQPITPAPLGTDKSNNSEWALCNQYLKTETQHAAAARFMTTHDPRDLSDLLEELLTDWLCRAL